MKFTEAQKKAVALFETEAFIQRVKEEDPTMLKHLPLLQKINKLGFLTVNSQAGNRSKGKGYEILERAYLVGFMLEKDAEQFIKNMGVHTDKNAVYVPVCDETPSSLDVPLTITKKDDVKVETHMSTSLPKEAEAFFRKMAFLNKSEKVVFLFCWDPLWCRLASGRNGLFTDVIRVLSDSF